MELHLPACWPQFHCIASACTHNCCIGWEIDIDEKTAQRYRQLDGPLGEELRQKIDWEAPDGPFFQLEGERCPFLTGENLCEIQQALGHEGLCEICSQHPRFQNTFGKLKEMGLGLCCEEAARLIFTGPRPSVLMTQTVDEPEEELENALLLEPLLQLRETMFRLLEQTDRPFSQRLTKLLSLAGEAQDWLSALPDELTDKPVLPDFSPAAETAPAPILPVLDSVVETFSQMEPVDDEWEQSLARVEGWLSALTEEEWQAAGKGFSRDAFGQEVYLRLAEYLLYRYLLQSLEDRDLLTRVQMVVISCVMVRMMELAEQRENFTLDDCIRLTGLWSRQLEYSLENLALLADACFLEPQLQYEPLLTLAASFSF